MENLGNVHAWGKAHVLNKGCLDPSSARQSSRWSRTLNSCDPSYPNGPAGNRWDLELEEGFTQKSPSTRACISGWQASRGHVRVKRSGAVRWSDHVKDVGSSGLGQPYLCAHTYHDIHPSQRFRGDGWKSASLAATLSLFPRIKASSCPQPQVVPDHILPFPDSQPYLTWDPPPLVIVQDNHNMSASTILTMWLTNCLNDWGFFGTTVSPIRQNKLAAHVNSGKLPLDLEGRTGERLLRIRTSKS